MVRFMGIGCALTFAMMTLAAGLLLIGYYYRGWPETLTTFLARVLILSSPTPTLVAMNWSLGLVVPGMDEWIHLTLVALLFAVSVVICVYGYSKFYIPFLRQHPAYRIRRR